MQFREVRSEHKFQVVEPAQKPLQDKKLSRARTKVVFDDSNSEPNNKDMKTPKKGGSRRNKVADRHEIAPPASQDSELQSDMEGSMVVNHAHRMNGETHLEIVPKISGLAVSTVRDNMKTIEMFNI